jgi:hypothetical protein
MKRRDVRRRSTRRVPVIRDVGLEATRNRWVSVLMLVTFRGPTGFADSRPGRFEEDRDSRTSCL